VRLATAVSWVALCVAAGAGCAAGPSPAREADARRTLERAIAAQGGRAAIAAIGALREVARVEYRGHDLHVTTWLGRPDKLRQIIVNGDTEQHSILDGERAWAVIRSGSTKPIVSEILPPGVAKLQELRKNWVPVLGAEAESLGTPGPAHAGPEPRPRIRATDRHGRTRVLTFSAQTGLLATITANPGGEEVEYRYEDYRAVRSLSGGAILWPHRITVSAGGRVTKRIRTVTIELDPELPPKAFRP
jgi:hypothetical protein